MFILKPWTELEGKHCIAGMHYDYDCDYGNDKKQDTKSFLMTMTMPERIYNSHYSNGVLAMFTS